MSNNMKQYILPWGLFLLAVFIGITGVLMILDTWGVNARYYASTLEWQGKPLVIKTDETPSVKKFKFKMAPNFVKTFSVKWQGWLLIEQGGTYTFTTVSDERSSLTIDGNLVIANEGGSITKPKRGAQKIKLKKGLYPIQVLYSNTGRSFMQTFWIPPKSPRSLIPSSALFSKRPGWLRIQLRKLSSLFPYISKNILGALLLLASFVLLQSFFRCYRPLFHACGTRLAGSLSRNKLIPKGLSLAFLVSLFGLVFWKFLPFLGGLYGYDDVYYMYSAMFSTALGSRVNRYVHIYLLKPFLWISGGDAFLGVRFYWSCMFAATVTALAIAVKYLGKGWQLWTLILTLFMFFAQSNFFRHVGTAWPDYTITMLITAAVAVSIHSLSSKPEFHHRHAFLIGIITVLAFKSKEVGIITVWFLLPLLFEESRFCLKQFPRKFLYWAVGAVLSVLFLMTLDAIFLGDFFFSIRSSSFSKLAAHNFGHYDERSRSMQSWMSLVWDSELRIPTVLLLVNAMIMTYKKKKPERQLLYLMPIAYVLMLMLAHIKGTFWFNPRHLYIITPTLCFLAGSFFYDLGVDNFRITQIVSSKFYCLISIILGGTAYGVVQYQSGRFTVSELSPFVALKRLGWTPEMFITSTIIPGIILVLIVCLCFFRLHQKIRVLAIVALLIIFLEPSVYDTIETLRSYTGVRRSETLLYPLRIFEEELELKKDTRILIVPDLLKSWFFGFHKDSAWRTISLFFQTSVRENIIFSKKLSDDDTLDYAFGTVEDYERWKRNTPELISSVKVDTDGGIVLVTVNQTAQLK